MSERESMTPVERYEADAEAFRRETGFMAPGKDRPAALGGIDADLVLLALWRLWLKTRVVVLDEWRVVDKRGHHRSYHPFVLRTPEDHIIAVEWCDQQSPQDAPHRIARVALVADGTHSAELNSSPRVVVTNLCLVVTRYGDVCHRSLRYIKDAATLQALARDWDADDGHLSPHRVVRVALVSEEDFTEAPADGA
ncbi:MAG: hypothetical protein ACK5VE_06560 [Alphaproteobacteria bacterium]|jgi:hypothetical protein